MLINSLEKKKQPQRLPTIWREAMNRLNEALRGDCGCAGYLAHPFEKLVVF